MNHIACTRMACLHGYLSMAPALRELHLHDRPNGSSPDDGLFQHHALRFIHIPGLIINIFGQSRMYELLCCGTIAQESCLYCMPNN